MKWHDIYTPEESTDEWRQNNTDLKLFENCVMNGLLFGIMLMTATGLENSPESFDVYTVSQSHSVVTYAENPAPENSPQSIGELRIGLMANLQELLYQTGSKNGEISNSDTCVNCVFLRITTCFPYWWCTEHAQLIMGTWSIYKKKHFLQLILIKTNFHLIKCLLTTLRFSFLVNMYLYTVIPVPRT